MIELEQQGYLGLYIDQRQARWQHRLGAAKRSGRIDSSQGRSLDTYVGLTRTPLSIHLSTYKIYKGETTDCVDDWICHRPPVP